MVSHAILKNITESASGNAIGKCTRWLRTVRTFPGFLNNVLPALCESLA